MVWRLICRKSWGRVGVIWNKVFIFVTKIGKKDGESVVNRIGNANHIIYNDIKIKE